jgi:hypothetical protein
MEIIIVLLVRVKIADLHILPWVPEGRTMSITNCTLIHLANSCFDIYYRKLILWRVDSSDVSSADANVEEWGSSTQQLRYLSTATESPIRVLTSNHVKGN